MSDTLRQPLYQMEPDERTSGSENPAETNGPSCNGDMSDADAANLLRSHRLPGSDLLPFLDSAASPPPAVPSGGVWTRCRRALAARLGRWFRARP
jgi:hypothetical protein